MKTSIGDIPARELIDELIRRLGVAEVCRRLELPESTDLCQLADQLDRL
ncbi:hypothetical protein H7K38_26635 [Mycobacterium alsense]|uniref:Uncharacterized protein n=1 Tax=Mycobacterium alsense TaxID=324058 RepID=A0AA42C1E3_9MYCO|nr:hypothetical protein [Mycobacterium alsense]MCV7382196.1 hypothetical protein [Mycobacterium alsense]